jgi:hypothetical protein
VAQFTTPSTTLFPSGTILPLHVESRQFSRRRRLGPSNGDVFEKHGAYPRARRIDLDEHRPAFFTACRRPRQACRCDSKSMALNFQSMPSTFELVPAKFAKHAIDVRTVPAKFSKHAIDFRTCTRRPVKACHRLSNLYPSTCQSMPSTDASNASTDSGSRRPILEGAGSRRPMGAADRFRFFWGALCEIGNAICRWAGLP